MSSPAVFFVVYKDSNRMVTTSLSEHSDNSSARRYMRKMIRKGIYLKTELDILVREIRFGEGEYGL